MTYIKIDTCKKYILCMSGRVLIFELITAFLSSNSHVHVDALHRTNPKLEYIISAQVGEEMISKELIETCHFAWTQI